MSCLTTSEIEGIALEAAHIKFADSTGILLCGSAAQGKLQEHSDLDLLIFYEDIHSYYREVYSYEGWVVEAMVYPLSSFKAMAISEGEERKNALKELCVKSIILKDTGGKLATLKEEISDLYQRGPEPLSAHEIRQQRYIITNRLDDFMGSTHFTESYFILQDLLTHLLDFILLYHQQWPFKGSGKWQIKAFRTLDAGAYDELKHAIAAFCQIGDKSYISELVYDYLHLAGGKLKSGYKRGVPPGFNKSRKWYTIEIYHAKSPNDLITEAVFPFCQTLRQNQWVEKCFFSRYTENGLHTSLMLITDEVLFKQNIIPLAETVIGSYLKSFPSERVTPHWTKHLPKDQQWFPDNTMQYHTQEVIPSLYGGTAATELIEGLFDFSSTLVSEMIKGSSGWPTSRALGTAIQLSLATASAMEISPEQLHTFSFFHLKDLLPFIAKASPSGSQEKIGVSAMEKKFSASEKKIQTLVQTTWARFHTQPLTSESSREAQWWYQVNEFKKNIEILDVQGKLLMPEVSSCWKSPVDQSAQNTFLYFKQIVHMINNQLGLCYADECYLAYILYKCSHILSPSKL